MYTEKDELIKSIPNIERLKNKTVLVTGATGLIGSGVVDFLLFLNKENRMSINVIATGRNINSLRKRYKNDENLFLMELNLDDNITNYNFEQYPNFIIHAASAANPNYYQNNPVETMTGNFLGCLNLLNFFSGDKLENFLFISSGEIYGEFPGTVTTITEEMSGYIDILSQRSCYPMSKRSAETLCISYSSQFNQKVTIGRPSHIFGPNFNEFDNRVSADFFRKALKNENIVMKSLGQQIRSYTYIDDCVTGILSVLLNGKNKNAYNITNTENEIRLCDFAKEITKQGNVSLIFDLKSNSEVQKTMNYASFSNQKLKDLGWNPLYNIELGVSSVFKQLKLIKK